jgi:hypothetical protein
LPIADRLDELKCGVAVVDVRCGQVVGLLGDFTVRLWDTAPLKNRYQARREAEALRPEAERLVSKLFQEKRNADQVATFIRSERSVSEPQRHAALRAMLRRANASASRSR